MSEGRRARPQPTPETQHFWDGTRSGELRLQRCNACAKVVFPAAAVLPRLRRTRGQRLRRVRQGPALLLCDPPPAGAGLHPALCDRRRRIGRGAAPDDQHHRVPADPRGVGARHAGRNRLREARRRDHPPALPPSPEVSAMQPKSIAIVGAAETTRARRHPRHVADPIACRRGTQCNGRCRPQTRRHRRHRDRRRDAGDDYALPWPHPEMGRRHRGRRLLVHDPCAPRRGGDRLGPVRDGADHPWRERPLRASGAPAMSSRRRASPASSSSPMGRWGRRLCSRSRCCAT